MPFLAWVDEAPRSYADAEAWRRSCPHLSIWEDSIAGGLIRFANGCGKTGTGMLQSCLALTPRPCESGAARPRTASAAASPLPEPPSLAP